MSNGFQEPPHKVIWTKILGYLNMEEVESCRLVSTKWKNVTDEVIKSNSLVKAKLQREMNAEIVQMPGNHREIELQNEIKVQRICPELGELPDGQIVFLIENCCVDSRNIYAVCLGQYFREQD